MRLIKEYLPAMSFFRRGMTEAPGTTWSEDLIPEDHRPGIEAAIKNMADQGATTVDYKHYQGTNSPYNKILGKFNPEPVMTKDGKPAVRIRDEFDTNATREHLNKEIFGNVFKNPLRAGWKTAELVLKGRTDRLHGEGKSMPGFDATIPISPELYGQLTKGASPALAGDNAVSPPMQNLNNHLSGMAGGGEYVVKKGENLTNIAEQNGMSLDELLQLNKQYRANPSAVNVGASLKLRG